MHHSISQIKTPTWCNTVQVLFLQDHSSCFGRKRPSSGVFNTSTAATGTCVIVVGQSSHLLIRTFQMKHQLDATLCRFYFCWVTLHVSDASAHHQEYLKLVQRPLVHVLSLKVSHHISLLGPFGPNKEMWWLTCNYNTCTSGRCTSFKYSWWRALAPETCRLTLQK